MSAGTANLSINGLTVDLSDKTAVDDVSLMVEPGNITALLGPNGAGKSELVLAAAGVLPKKSGTVLLGGQDISGFRPEKVRACGLAAVPEGHQVLSPLTVEENLLAAGAMLPAAELNSEVDNAYEVFPELIALKAQPAGSLSGGQQQMVAIAQALVCRPKFLLIDEMSLGLAPVVIERLIEVVRHLKSQGMGILLIEQFTHLALELADRAMIISRGRIRYEGSPDELKSKPDLLHAAYLAA